MQCQCASNAPCAERQQVGESVRVTAYFGSRNHEARFASKYNHVRIDGEPYNGSRPALTTSGVNGRDEIAECQALLLIGFHDVCF